MTARAVWRRRPSRAGLVRAGLAVLTVVAIIVLAWVALRYAPFLRVESVEYRTAPQRVEALRAAAPVGKGQPLIEVDTDDVERQVKSSRLFGSVRVSRSWPSTVVVEATPREPVVAVRGPGVSGVQLVDTDGVGFEAVPAAPDGLPVATAAAPDDAGVMRSLATVVTSLSPELAGSLKNVAIDERGAVTMVIDGVDVTWGTSEDSRVKTAIVRDLVNRAGVVRIDVSAPMAPVTASERGTSTTGPTESGTPSGSTSPSPSGSPTGSTRDSGPRSTATSSATVDTDPDASPTPSR